MTAVRAICFLAVLGRDAVLDERLPGDVKLLYFIKVRSAAGGELRRKAGAILA